MPTTSIIIPSRNEPYLGRTVNDLLEKAKGEIEIIAILDGWWPSPEDISVDKRVNYVHFQEPRGMRNAINTGAMIARGEYLMKCDAHCMFGEGYDVKLAENCSEKRVVIPRRYALDVEKWKIEERSDDKYPIDHMILDENLQGVPTKRRISDDNNYEETMTSQGSCWFMRKSYFNELELMDEENYGTFWMEMQEVGFKCWLSGGQMVSTKDTWYAHWHKQKSRGYSLPDGEKERTKEFVHKWKTGKMWHKQTKNLEYLFDKFKVNLPN